MTAATLVAAVSFPALAQDGPNPRFALPVDCALGEDCFIQQYVDHDPGPGARDFACAPHSYDGHKGTDFALPTHADLAREVRVTAIAPGRIRGARDGMPDRAYTEADAAALEGRDCGNGVLIEHDDGWTSQYCHMARGSIAVREGQRVEAGTTLGHIGLSGRTQFPHLHLTLRHEGRVVDPFDPDGESTCATPSTETLWQDDVAYTPGGLLSVGFSDSVPGFDAIRAGQADEPISPETPALVFWAFAFGGHAGDVLRLDLVGPEGDIIRHDARLEKDQAQFFRAAGRKLRGASWPSGAYTGTATFLRDGTEIDRRNTRFTLP
ncbi:M23 family metallopeptidase [Roseovarius sp. SCSIO 43702]|uniref:M23 family metallopeptidase n=1 Tax=Roseovarius sp. SCSIO 43702 TaxID=2823043 RepID=UPI001C737A41|nr:M23 family metallopeptidase [Roseovarius sp. SCSIO 43702]QYX57696.1 M23 family metallopeptidase [Roseovarius sp. SCSIO 43702]